jgi:hypothetical protein
MDLLNEHYLKHAQLEENLCVDEFICPYYGKHSAKQFIRGKPIRFGYKFWCLCTKKGYLVRFEPYQGATGEKNVDLGVGGSVVMRLVSALPRNHYNIYADRFFSSIKLAFELKSRGFGYTGTVSTNRVEKCPIDNIEKKPRGDRAHKMDASTGKLG